MFVIGNGFDLAHKFNTHYSDFRNFLNNECGESLSYIPQTNMDQDGDIIADRESTAGLLMDLIDNATQDDEWGDMEDAMGRFDYSSYFEDCDINVAIEEDDDNEMWRVAYEREDIASDLHICVRGIKDLFREWIDTVEINRGHRQKRFDILFDDDCEFLTFNYTKTLEVIYGIDPLKVCHIHGEQGVDIVVGHGNDKNPYSEESFELLGIDWKLEELFDDLRKDVQGCYRKHSDFFQRIKSEQIQEIYSFGFSFSAIDCYYIKQICKMIDTTNVIWHLSKFDGGKNITYKQCIKDCGFNGTFGKLIPNR